MRPRGEKKLLRSPTTTITMGVVGKASVLGCAPPARQPNRQNTVVEGLTVAGVSQRGSQQGFIHQLAGTGLS